MDLLNRSLDKKIQKRAKCSGGTATLYSRLLMFKSTQVRKVISVNSLFLTLFERVYVMLSEGCFHVLLYQHIQLCQLQLVPSVLLRPS